MPTSYAPQELLLTEEKAVNQLELDREKDSVAHLSQTRADIEGTVLCISLYLIPVNHITVIRRAASDPSDAKLDQIARRQGVGVIISPSFAWTSEWLHLPCSS